MEPTFRQSMAWLHTWCGVVIGAVLFAIVWMGTLAVFDREIDRWMMPLTRLQAPAAPVSLDSTVRPIAERLAAESPQWFFVLPTERAPTLQVLLRDASGKNVTRHLNPSTGMVLPDAGTYGGTRFIYPFHYRLHITFMDIGYWLVGLAAMAMLALLVSGVVIHRKIFRDFFTFRPKKHLQRSSLDLHNLTGVVALPFHFVITLSGLIIFFSIYFPSAWQAAYQGDRQAFLKEAFGGYQRAKANAPGTLGSLDAMVDEAQRLWGGGKPSSVRVAHPGDANAYVEVRRSFADRITMHPDTVYFDAATGVMLHRQLVAPVLTVQRFISGLHFIQFRHWTLRWLYFVLGLSGCVMIATGFLFWLEARRAQHAKQGLAGVRVVEALAVGSVTGIILATLAFFIANRLLPLGASVAGADRAALEMWMFYLTWALTFVHAARQARSAWGEQSRAIAVLALAAVAFNWTTTGDHLLRTLSTGIYGVAGMDALLLLSAAVAWRAARKLRQRSIAHADSSPGHAAKKHASTHTQEASRA